MKAFFIIENLFDVVSGKTSNLKLLAPGTTPFISASEKNNGISAYIDDVATFEGNQITISRNGSVCEVFYQPVPFCASLDDIRVLKPKNFKLNKYIALYLCAIIKKEKFRYTYGRKFGTDRIKKSKIELPSTPKGQPDWNWMEEFIISEILPKNELFSRLIEDDFSKKSLMPRNLLSPITNWKKFKYGGANGVFIIKNGYYNKKPDHTSNGIIPFIGSTEYNNGITEYYCYEDIKNNNKDSRSSGHPITSKIFKGNCITVSNNGSVGNAFYQEVDFTCSHDVNVLYLKHGKLNKYVAMFICSIIKLEKYRWNYGRKWRPSRMPSSEILLPVDKDGNPDLNYMEKYIMGLEYSGTI